MALQCNQNLAIFVLGMLEKYGTRMRDTMSINKNWSQVKAFHKAFDIPVSESPVLLSRDRVEKRSAWMEEEVLEFKEASTIEEQADAMIDLIYFALGTMVEMGVEPEEIFNIVQEANMSKLWEDGKPHYNEDTKVIKPPTWKDPEDRIKNEILRQIRTKKRVV